MNETDAAPDTGASADAAPFPEPIEALVETWWADHFPGSPVAQLTPAWNHAFAAKEALKRRLATLVAGEG